MKYKPHNLCQLHLIYLCFYIGDVEEIGGYLVSIILFKDFLKRNYLDVELTIK
jgi:hypothetical protein